MPAAVSRAPDTSPYHLIGAQQDGLQDGDAQRFGGLEVDHKFELGRLLDWQVTRFGAIEDLVHLDCGGPEHARYVWSIRNAPTHVHELAHSVNGGKPVFRRKLRDLPPFSADNGIGRQHERLSLLSRLFEGAINGIRIACSYDPQLQMSRRSDCLELI